MGFEVGTLGVNFFTAFIVTHVDPPPLDVGRVRIDGLQVHHRPEREERGVSEADRTSSSTGGNSILTLLHTSDTTEFYTKVMWKATNI